MQLMLVSGVVQEAPVMRYTNTGEAILNFTVVSEYEYHRNGQRQTGKKYTRVVVWGEPNATDMNMRLNAGAYVFVQGTPSAKGYLGKQDGQPKASLECRARRVSILSGANAGWESGQGQGQQQNWQGNGGYQQGQGQQQNWQGNGGQQQGAPQQQGPNQQQQGQGQQNWQGGGQQQGPPQQNRQDIPF